MKILFVASEAHPFIKTGGLGDVAYALPKALRKLGLDVRVILPKYSIIDESYKKKMLPLATFNVPVGWRNQYGGLQYFEQDGIPFYFIDNEYYFNRDEAYGFYDDGERFSYFCRAVLEAVNYMIDFTPDIIHLNDWHTGMISPIMNEHFKYSPRFHNIKTIFTIHNLKYQGIFPKEILGDLLNLSNDYFRDDKLKYYDGVSFMKGGLNFSHKISTVSKAYAEEIKTSFYGEGLHGLLQIRSNDLIGIVNGIDTEIFNPKTDAELYFNYDYTDIYGKTKNKLELQKSLGLNVDENIPMIGMVTRLTGQKGLDLVAHVMEELLKLNLQLVVLGTGEKKYEDMIKYYAGLAPQKLSANITFNNTLAKRIYASSDIFLMPSLFEPCGIGQLLALRYGSLPLVRETGGLKDTVFSYNEYTNNGNGFSFANYNADDMLYTIKRALNFYKNKEVWNNLVKNAMMEDNSWRKSAQEYKNLYSSLL
ncbi:glycogen synthase GlgA [Clostridium sp. SYSU_GA19001]|uniref:glycogen synthase GlgA n=1 Tax=Clostridium caldaquaticum TaxID=2940653 RepID=UPI002077727B|nr:glycogen synthase GlgA [Clostridium caldaquaticum]MCM8710199.1 glycogen synthase GlgA [Clostridium caldaquaticum]